MMVQFTLAIACIAFAIAVISFLLILVLINGNIKSTNNTSNNSSESDEYQKGWQEAITFMVSNIHLTMFDLYRTQDVLDFETNLESFTKRMDHIVTNPNYRDDAIIKYKEYMKENQ